MSKSLVTLNETIGRARALLNATKIDCDLEITVKEEIARSALVLAVAGFDRFFTHKFSDLLSDHLKGNEASAELLDLMTRSGITLKLTLKLLSEKRDRPFRTIRNLLQRSLFNLTTQQTKEIDKLFEKIGIHKLTDRVMKASREKLLIDRVNKAVFRRHKIVHEGDLNQHHRTNRLSNNNVEKWISALEKFACKADEIIEAEFNKKTYKSSKL